MKKFLRKLFVLLTGFAILLGNTFSLKAASIYDFTDLDPSSWYFSVVQKAYESGIMTGLNESQFGPDRNITRGMVATVFYRMAKGSSSYRPIFSDVKPGLYYSEAITWAYDNGILSGYSNSNRFGPDDYITRQDLSVIAARYSHYLGRDTNSSIDLSGFCDYQDISSYAYNGVNWIVSKRIMNGSNGYIKPLSNATRAECAKIFLLTKQGQGNLSTSIPNLGTYSCSAGGITTNPSTPNTPSIPSTGGIYYWTASGKSYHSTSGCPTLKRSKNIYSGSLNDARNAGKFDPCNICIH